MSQIANDHMHADRVPRTGRPRRIRPVAHGIARNFWVVALVGLVLLLAWSPALAQADKLVAAVSKPGTETNRFWSGSTMWHVMDPALEGLLDQDPVTGENTDKGLAVSWEASDDFKVWTFKLREGVQFHHGWGEFTAADVVHSYKLHTGPDAIIPTVDQLRGAEAEAVDRYTVRFTYSEPNKNLLFLHGGRSVMKIYSKAQFDKEGLEGYDRRFAGTGQYQFVSRKPGQILYERFDKHYSSGKPDFRVVEFRFVDEPATKLAMLLSGEAAIADLPRELMKDALAGGMKTAESARAVIQTDVVLNGLYCESGDEACGKHLPWYNRKIREAMNIALNREEMVQVLFPGGGAKLLPRYAMTPGHEGYDPTLVERFKKEYGYNPERAKKLMKEAGYPDAFKDPTIHLVLKPSAGVPEVALQMELIHQYLTAVGFKAELREIDHATVGAMGRARKAYIIHPSKNAPPRPTEVAFRAFYSKPGGPYQGWEDDFTSSNIKAFRAERDPEKRDAIARKLFNYLFEQYVSMPMFELRTQLAFNPKMVASWQFPGVTSTGYGHWHTVKAAK